MPSPASRPLPPRTDKWYVGCGDGLIWAPPFPAWQDTPGFWDEAHLLQYRIQPLFAVSFVGPEGRAPRLRARAVRWTPDAFALAYAWDGLTATEIRSAPGGRMLVSEWTVRNRSRRARQFDVVVWAAVDGEGVPPDGAARSADGLTLVREVTDRAGRSRTLALDYALSGVRSRAGLRSEHSGGRPDFELTPFHDRWGPKGLAQDIRLEGIDRKGLVYVALARRCRLRPGASLTFAASVRITPLGIPVPPAPRRRSPTPAHRTAARSWTEWLAGFPQFTCGEPYFRHYWDYRWYGLRLNAVPGRLGQYRSPTVCEGIGYFHQPISYSAMCHARELRWNGDPARARGVIETFFDHQAADGSLPGRIPLDHLTRPDFYHADWGGAVEDVDDVHPDRRWLVGLYPRLARYAAWLTGTRDAEGSGMIDVVDQFETGQEYMSRYQAVDPDADRYGWENRIRLKGIDVTVYAYRLYRLLARLAPDATAAALWQAFAERTRVAVRERMWDQATGMFSDVDPQTGARTGVKAAVCFYPYLTDLVDRSHVAGLGRHLFRAGEFWTPWPVPSSSVDDPRFDPDAEWRGKRHVCPWNGRVWPMTNSHVVDALARVVRLYRPDWAPRLVHLLRRSVAMMSVDQDPTRPNAFEHYHPYNGRGSAYRGIDDYQHSWVNDLLVRHVAGLLPQGTDGIVVDPLPIGEPVALTDASVAGHRVDVRVTGARFEVRVDGRRAAASRIGIPVEVRW